VVKEGVVEIHGSGGWRNYIQQARRDLRAVIVMACPKMTVERESKEGNR